MTIELRISANTGSFHPDRKPKPVGRILYDPEQGIVPLTPLCDEAAEAITAYLYRSLTNQQLADIDDLLEPYGLKSGLLNITGYVHTSEVEQDCKD